MRIVSYRFCKFGWSAQNTLGTLPAPRNLGENLTHFEINLSCDLGSVKCRDPLYIFRHCMECRNPCAMFSSSHSLEELKVLRRASPPHVAALTPLEAQLLM